MALPSVSILDLVVMFSNIQDIVAHPESSQDPGFQKFVTFDTLDVNQDSPGAPLKRCPEQRQPKHLEIVRDLVWPLEVLVQVLIRFPHLESVKVGRRGYIETGEKKSSFQPSLYHRSRACVVSLTHLDLNGIVYEDYDQMVWFFRRLQTVDRLSSLVLPIQHLRHAQYNFVIRSAHDGGRFFLFPRLERLTITHGYIQLWICTSGIK